jgi:hypothetical protein
MLNVRIISWLRASAALDATSPSTPCAIISSCRPTSTWKPTVISLQIGTACGSSPDGPSTYSPSSPVQQFTLCPHSFIPIHYWSLLQKRWYSVPSYQIIILCKNIWPGSSITNYIIYLTVSKLLNVSPDFFPISIFFKTNDFIHRDIGFSDFVHRPDFS